MLEGGRELAIGKGETCEFEMRDVTFRYPNAGRPVLEHFNLRVNAGEKLAVVGLNGAGKTTLIKLLCGFLDPDSGQVLLNPGHSFPGQLGEAGKDQCLLGAAE